MFIPMEDLMKEPIETLENLIAHTQDSINGYREAAELVRDDHPDLARIFTECGGKRTRLLEALRNQLRTLDPANDALTSDGTVMGDLHNKFFMKFRSLFQKDSKAALQEVENGENYLVEQFEDARDDAPPHLHAALNECLSILRSDERAIEAMRRAA